jgi:hypothetical protein
MLSVLSKRHRKINEANKKCMHGQHLLTLSNAFFKFTVFELYKEENLTSEVEVRTSVQMDK